MACSRCIPVAFTPFACSVSFMVSTYLFELLPPSQCSKRSADLTCIFNKSCLIKYFHRISASISLTFSLVLAAFFGYVESLSAGLVVLSLQYKVRLFI